MLLFIINSFKKHSAISLFLASALLLTACGGGGGGGGGGGLATRVVVVSPADESAISDSSDDFEIDFVSEKTDGLVITLNGKDVTALFSPVDPEDPVSNRTASVFALSGFLEQGENFFNAKVGNSKVSGVAFTYDAEPEIILTGMTGIDSQTVNGVTRKSTLDTVTINGMDADIRPVMTPPYSCLYLFGSENCFTLELDDIIAPSDSVTITPDYTIDATDIDGDLVRATLIAPTATIKYGAAIQLNNSAFDVIASWVGTVLENHLNTIFAEFEGSPHSDPTKADSTYTSLAYGTPGLTPIFTPDDAEDCTLLNFAASSTRTACNLFVSAISKTGAVTTDVKVLGDAVDDSFPVEVTVTFDQLNVTIDSAAFDGGLNYLGSVISTLQFGANDTPEEPQNVEFTIKVNVSKSTGRILDVVLPASPATLSLGLANGADSDCHNICTKTPSEIDAAFTAAGTAATNILQGQILAELAAALKPSWTIENIFNGVITVPDSVSANSLPDGAAVQLTTTDTLPAGFSTGVTYYVVDSDHPNHTLNLATTVGGDAIASSGSGFGEHTITTTMLTSIPNTNVVARVKGPDYETVCAATGITHASPAVINVTADCADSLSNGTALRLSTTGALPTGLLTGKTYYITGKAINTGTEPDSYNLNLALLPGGAAINTTSSGSGIHTLLTGVNVSSIKFALSGSEVTEAISGTVQGGFIALGGSTYADDTGYGEADNDLAALGSYFDPLAATEMTSHLMGTNTAGNDVMIALSENSLNQLLLSVYQTQLLTHKTLEFTIADLGTTEGSLGKSIVDKTALLAFLSPPLDIDYDDTVKISMSLEAVPHANFITDADTSALQLNLYALRVIVRVYRDGELTPVGGVADTINLLVDVKARLDYGLDPVTALPLASIDNSNVVLSVVSVSSLQNVVTADSVLQDFPKFIGEQIQDLVGELNNPIVQDLDLAGLGLFDKSAWLVLKELKVDAQQEYILLKAEVVDENPAPKKGFIQLNMLDSYCDVVSVPVDCPNYVPPAP